MTNDHPTHPHQGIRSADWWNNKWTRFAAYWRGSTSRLNVLIGGVLVFIGFSMVYVQLRTINDNQRESDQRAVANEIYQASIVTYSQDVATYRLCLDSVERSDNNRQQWQTLVDRLRVLDLNEDADALAAGPLLSSEPRSSADCTDPGPPPEPPEG